LKAEEAVSVIFVVAVWAAWVAENNALHLLHAAPHRVDVRLVLALVHVCGGAGRSTTKGRGARGEVTGPAEAAAATAAAAAAAAAKKEAAATAPAAAEAAAVAALGARPGENALHAARRIGEQTYRRAGARARSARTEA
jgi:hypothetical protein